MPPITPAGYAFIGLTAIVAVLVAILVFAVLRFASAARDTRRHGSGSMETALLSAALQEAVSKLKAQEQANRARAEASERLSEQIVAGLTSGLLLVGVEGDVRILNPAARRILGLQDAALPAPWASLLGPWPALAGVVGEGLRSGTPIIRRAVSVGTPARPLHLGVTVSPLAEAGVTGQGAICLFSDLTSVVALEEQLRMKEALARLGELTAGLAHEFRNGLATIHGYARLLDPATLEEPERTYVQGLRDETTALGEVVHNFLNFAKPQPLTLVPLDLQAVVARAAEDAGSDAVRIAVAGPFGEVEGDEVLLRQAFSNLIRNAVEACQAAGVAPVVEVVGEAGGADAWVCVTVRDNGPGFAPDALERAFQPFFTTKASGTGLGLALVQKIVVTHNGRVWATPGAGGGAEVHVQLPRPRG
ncbi:MAG: ATP-binding protein [Vicinamibacterales bacterium]|nr:ATP-binding protein [Vicinamibacterales bacterium]